MLGQIVCSLGYDVGLESRIITDWHRLHGYSESLNLMKEKEASQQFKMQNAKCKTQNSKHH